MQDLKQGGIPYPATAVCCPNCGAPSTLGKLESGCESCNTKFLMDELYPKVMHFFIKEDGKELLDKAEIKKYALVCAVLALALFAVSTLLKVFIGVLDSQRLLIDIVPGIMASAILGVMFGSGAWF